jgi:hypothetical protein
METTRRDLLKAAGVAAATLLPFAPERASAHGDEGTSEHPEEGASSQRLRRWVMVIDLRACDG